MHRRAEFLVWPPSTAMGNTQAPMRTYRVILQGWWLQLMATRSVRWRRARPGDRPSARAELPSASNASPRPPGDAARAYRQGARAGRRGNAATVSASLRLAEERDVLRRTRRNEKFRPPDSSSTGCFMARAWSPNTTAMRSRGRTANCSSPRAQGLAGLVTSA